MTIDLDRVEELADRLEESFPRRPDEAMSTWARRGFGEGFLNRDELEALLAFCLTKLPGESEVDPDDSDAADEPPFALVGDDKPWVPWAPEPTERKAQRALLSGLDCKAGQLDLFATDGEEEGGRPQALHHLIDDVAEGCFDG